MTTDTTEPTAAAPALKLSELIRKGAAMVDGQCQGTYINQWEGNVYCCALGAAYFAYFGRKPNFVLTEEKEEMLAAVNVTEQIETYVIKLNDTKGMTFEEIAAALEAKGL